MMEAGATLEGRQYLKRRTLKMRNKEHYENLLKKLPDLDADLQELHEKETSHLTNDLVGYICKGNNLEKQIFTQKYRNCKSKCKIAEENIFHCEFCQEAADG